MAAIIPQGTIWLLKNIPLDNTYQHTLYWELSANGRFDQTDYFLSSSHIVGQPLTNQTYTRVNNNRIRVARLADDILLANYLVFCNSDSNFSSPKYSNKLYFCFITSINYINNNVTEIEFEIDVIQTWYFDFNLLPCFMERTHARTDAIGSNIVPEPLQLGEYVHATPLTKNANLSNDFYIIVASSDVTIGSVVNGSMYGGIYGGAKLRAFPSNSAGGVNQYLSDMVTAGKADAVVSIYMIPKFLIDSSITVPTDGRDLVPGDVITTPIELTLPSVSSSNPLVNDYTPHNNKLYTYPYTYLNIETPTGGKLTLRYEFFDGSTPKVRVGGCVTHPVQAVLMPYKYKQQLPTGYSTTLTDSLDESIVLDSYPVCSWSNDTYAAWVAQNSVPIQTQLMGQVISAIPSILTSPVFGTLSTVRSISHTVTSALAESQRASIVGDKLNGQMSGSPAVTMSKQAFWFSRDSIDESTARLIDSYFDMFGYAVKKIQEPVRKTRSFYTYIKTVGCVIEEKQWVNNPAFANTGIPADDANKICELHDAGITYWDVANLEENGTIGGKTYHVGDYSIAPYNSPIG